MNKTYALIACFCMLLSGHLRGQEGNTLFDPSYVHELHFTFFQDTFFEEMDSLWAADHDASGTNVPSTKALLQIDGQSVDTIAIRIKGLSSYYKANDRKKPFKIDLNEFVEGNEYDGLKKFNLHNGACDPSMLRDFLSYDILRTAGVRAPRVSHCRVYFNGEYWGVYSIIEQIDKTFLKNNFVSDDGTLIKNTGWDELKWKGATITPYLEDYELRTNEEVEDWSDFLNFMNVLNNSSNVDFAAAIQQFFDVDLYLHVMAADVMTNNWDSYIDGERNYYLYHEPTSNQFHWIPWDYNLSLGGALTIEGNPYPPFDSTCYIQASFSQISLGNAIQFTNESVPSVDNVLWDFGDGSTSTEINPAHAYSTGGKVNVCLTAYRTDAGQLCQNTRCQVVDLDFLPQACNTIINGSCPFPASDPYFQMVAQQDSYCCEDEWDALCTLQWFELSQSTQNNGIGSPGVTYGLNYPLIITDTNKVLIRRLMNVPEFRQRYLDICCVMLANNFTEDRLFPMIDEQANLIRQYIKDDPNYIFSSDYFEYDVGDGSGGGGEANIPALKWLLKRRFDQLSSNMLSIGHDCGDAFSPIGWHDLVINEFCASSSDIGGIPDAMGEYDDWIEIYNNSDETVQLDNFYLSDSPERPFKWTFPIGSIIEPHGYFMIWADQDEFQPGVHTNFKLSASGEFLILMHEDRTVIDSISFGEQSTNLPSARKPNGTGNFVSQSHTFASNNNLVNSVNGKSMDILFKVYPNPTNNQLAIELDESILHNNSFELHLCDALGRSLTIAPKLNSNKLFISTTSLPNGYYYLKLKIGDSSTLIKRFAVIH
ncbi:MAG: CotH kinase family protein [Saprospiraceae bacterium]|nr:CotH kinase family protein [Saprospiraceae bacterium]MCF8252438.1 CotH kinase family protein [Saprospiraceae bacterium]MCF8282285.1 CotH kinase family protein [Bacteroidales bacterium]MCF8314036.1 CotH kinase family protein [Saprospiraceae bacterium]MCF8442768.1 CotH kinase family protein [Saprospiraceae bacterium]